MIIFDIFRRRRPEPVAAPIEISAGEQMIADADADLAPPKTWEEDLARLTPEEQFEKIKRALLNDQACERAIAERTKRRIRREGTR